MNKQYFYLEKALQPTYVELSSIIGFGHDIEHLTITIWYPEDTMIYCLYKTKSDVKYDWERLVKALKEANK